MIKSKVSQDFWLFYQLWIGVISCTEAFDREFPYMEKKKLPGQIFE